MKSIKDIKGTGFFQTIDLPPVAPTIRGKMKKETEKAIEKAIQKHSKELQDSVSKLYWDAVNDFRMRELKKIARK